MRRFALVGIGTFAGFGIAVACADPYEGDIPTPAPERDSSIAPDVADETSPTSDAGGSDAGADVDPCDRDRDGVRSQTCEGGADCDDEDERAQPEAGFRSDEPTPKTKGDWNCDGKVTAEHSLVFNCSAFNSFAVSCSTLEGFKDNPGCGMEGTYAKCKNPPVLGGACIEDLAEKRKQACK